MLVYVLCTHVHPIVVATFHCRLTAPPEEAYSLHRKLSGAFLACIKLRANVPARQQLLDTLARHEFADDGLL